MRHGEKINTFWRGLQIIELEQKIKEISVDRNVSQSTWIKVTNNFHVTDSVKVIDSDKVTDSVKVTDIVKVTDNIS